MSEIQLVEVITSVQRRRRWSVPEKIRLVEETLQPVMSVSFVARTHGLSPSLLFKWRQRMAAGGREAVRSTTRSSAPPGCASSRSGSASSSGCWVAGSRQSWRRPCPA
jgi:transposase-like protein